MKFKYTATRIKEAPKRAVQGAKKFAKSYANKFTGKEELPKKFLNEYRSKARMSSDGGWIER